MKSFLRKLFMKNNIIIDCKNLAFYSSGIAGYFKPFLKALIEYFDKYHFILTAPYDFDTNFIKEFSNWEVKIVPYKKLGNNTLEIIYYDFVVYPTALKSIDTYLLISPYYDFIIPLKFKNRSIITVHDLCYWELDRHYSAKVKFYHKLLLNINISRTKKIVTVSQTSLKKIKRIFGEAIYDKSVVIYNTFEKNIEKNMLSNFKSSKKTLLYTGGFEQRKNIKMLFYALRQLKKELEIELIFTGNFQGNMQLKKMIKELDVEDIVTLTGIVSTEKLQEYYMKCDMVINISLCEGFGRSNLEAYIYNRPLVCSDIEVFRELVGNYAFYCNPYDSKSIQKAIKAVFQNSKKDYMINIERFKFEKNKKTFIDMVKDILAK